MWDRKDLKEKGKNAFRANRITCIFAAFILSIVSGTGSLGTSSVNSEQVDNLNIPPEVWKTIIAIVGGAVIVGFLLSIFVFNPVQVGLKQFFVQNATDSRTSLGKHNIGLAFSDNYTNIVAAMFTTGIFVFLWSLLLIVPGIIKGYSWRMVPYILSENPDITGTEARERSAQMMNGSKWPSFVLDLSFLGWILLGIITLGIGNLVWTNPYKDATDAELYRWLKGDRTAPQIAEPEYMDEAEIVAVPTAAEEPDDEKDDITFVK